MCDLYLNLIFEDELSGAVLKKIIQSTKRPFEIGINYRTGGFGKIKSKIKGFNRSAKGMPYCVLVDLDENECPPSLIDDWLDGPKEEQLIFRVAVREVESWLLASIRSFSKYFGLSSDVVIPDDVDSIEKPKEFLIDLIRNTRNRQYLNDIVPPKGSTARVGPDYNGRLVEYLDSAWDIDEAKSHSKSLDSAFEAINNFYS